MSHPTWPIPESVVLERVTDWATAVPAVRACLLTSSRAAAQPKLDEFSDYDIVLAVEPDAVTFTADSSWLIDAYGEPVVTHRSDYGADRLRTVMRLVVYADGTKIDFAVIPVDTMRAVVDGADPLPSAWDLGWRALVDKDGLTQGLAQPTYRAHIPTPPSQHEYALVVEEFWWESNYVAKNLWRRDLVQAKYNLDKVMIIDCLVRVLEWRIEIDNDWTVRPGPLGRYLSTRLDSATYQRLTRCFADGEVTSNWDALFRTADLFRDVTQMVADDLGLRYPTELDERVTAHLRWVRSLDEGRP